VTGRAWTDFGFHALFTGTNLAEVARFEPEEIASVKLFMAGHATAPYVVADQAILREFLFEMARRNLLVTVHAGRLRTCPLSLRCGKRHRKALGTRRGDGVSPAHSACEQ
jgi:hypothetical protein